MHVVVGPVVSIGPIMKNIRTMYMERIRVKQSYNQSVRHEPMFVDSGKQVPSIGYGNNPPVTVCRMALPVTMHGHIVSRLTYYQPCHSPGLRVVVDPRTYKIGGAEIEVSASH